MLKFSHYNKAQLHHFDNTVVKIPQAIYKHSVI